jgi:pimeloyl-ACP methyl ester carboxylesterase
MADFWVNGTRLHADERGEGSPTLVFMHYFAGSGQEWTGVVETLSDAYRCVTVDLRGHGQSDGPPAGYAVDQQADDVLELVRQLGADAYVLVGHSMSGKIALVAAARQPTGLQSLVLLAPSPLSPEPIPDETRARLLRTYGERVAAERTADEIVANRLPEAQREAVIADNLRTARPAWSAWLESGSREDLRVRAVDVEVPVWVLAGSRETNIPIQVLKTEVVMPLKNAALQIIPDAGHLLPLEKPRETAALIREFVATEIGKIQAREPKPKARSL